MVKLSFIFILLPVLFLSCSKQINGYKEKQKHGKWVYKTDNGLSRGRYLNGKQVGTWKTIQEGKLYRKERYQGTTSVVKYYHPNRRLMSKGRTESEITPVELHWYYSGTWAYYNEQGKLIEKRTYLKGEPVAFDTVARN